MGHLNNNPTGVEDEQSVGMNEEDQNMVDEVEDEEIRSPEATVPSPEKMLENERSLHEDPQKFSVQEQSPCPDTFDNERPLHENIGELHGDYSKPREPNFNNEEDNSMAAEKFNGGPIMQEEREGNIMDKTYQFGPTPIVGLGKRSRAHRSPPSAGSMQGPPSRGFFQDSPTGDHRIDLNRPLSATASISEENPGGASQAVSKFGSVAKCG
ncbi:hypothetical protein Hanom_Chr04g00342611 [Helianthus anomalus]